MLVGRLSVGIFSGVEEAQNKTQAMEIALVATSLRARSRKPELFLHIVVVDLLVAQSREICVSFSTLPCTRAPHATSTCFTVRRNGRALFVFQPTTGVRIMVAVNVSSTLVLTSILKYSHI